MHVAWRLHPADPRLADRLARGLHIHPITAQVLINRGVADQAHAERFLNPAMASLDDPFRLPDMGRGVDRLRSAIARRETILIFTDSDTDGLTAGAILYDVLRGLGAVVRARSSNRRADGYGFPQAWIARLARSATKLLILVDCGTNQAQEIHRLRAVGIDTIVIDHHVPLDGWATPHALINPYRGGTIGREFCSAGLALKVAHALLGGPASAAAEDLLDLAALGTLADCSPLVGENRAIVVAGLPRLVRSHRPGVQRLCEQTGVMQPLPDHVIQRLIPRLNASGRLGDASAIWRLLISRDEDPLDEWLEMGHQAHATTKQLYRQLLGEAQEQVSRLHFRDHAIMIVSGQGWHPGLMGPLASQLAQRYGRPSIALAMDAHRGIGSGRSIPVFNLLEALRRCQGDLMRFGGHAQACGLTVERGRFESFRERINQHAQAALGRDGLLKTRTADVEVPLRAVEPQWVGELDRLAPFGQGNPRPTVILRRVTMQAVSARVARLSDGAVSLRGKGSCLDVVPEGRYDVLGSPTLAEGEVVLTVNDVRAAAAPS